MAVSDYFVWGSGGAKLTPEELARQREIEDRLVQQGIDTSPVAHPLQGLARVANALAGAVRRGQLGKAEKANAAYNADLMSRMMGSSFPAAPPSISAPASSAEVNATSPAPATAAADSGLMGDFMAPIRETVKNPYALAAIASTGNAESGFDPAKANARWADPSQSGQAGTAGGVMSWRNDRLRALEDYAKLNGEDPSKISAATQGKFFLQEDPNLITALNGSKSLEEAQGLMDNAWKYAGYDQPSKERANRLASARSYLSAFQPTETASLDPSIGASPAGGANAWLRYANEGAKRDLPLDPKLVSALSFLGDMGVTGEVFSGGQSSKEEFANGTAKSKGYVGSPRHVHGGAGDFLFYKDGRRLDWANDADRPIFEEIVRRGKAAGITGFGAGEGYMQPGSMHIGFGNPAVWGANGDGENAAPWLRTAYNAAQPASSATGAIDAQMRPAPALPAPVNVPSRTVADPVTPDPQMVAQAIRARGGNPQAGILPVIAGEPGQTGMGQMDTRGLLGAASDPRATEGTRRIAEILIRQQMEQAQAAREAAIRQAERQATWAREDNRNAFLDKREAEKDAYGRQKDERTFGLQQKEFDFKVGEAGRTGDIKEYEYAKERGYEGSFPEYQRELKKAGAQNINMGEQDTFYKKLDEKNAETFAGLSDSGIQARAKIAQIDRLEGLMANAPQGAVGALKQAAGEWGIATEGLSDIQAATALLEKMVPEQRAPGSGPMSDADIKMFRSSLPRILNQKGGNQLIFQTIRGIAQYEQQMGEIADKVADRELSPTAARKMIRELKNPLADFKVSDGPTPNEGWKEIAPGVKIKKVGD